MLTDSDLAVLAVVAVGCVAAWCVLAVALGLFVGRVVALREERDRRR